MAEGGGVIGWNIFDDKMMDLPKWPTLWGVRASPYAPSKVVARFRALMLDIAQGPKAGEFSWSSMEKGLKTIHSGPGVGLISGRQRQALGTMAVCS